MPSSFRRRATLSPRRTAWSKQMPGIVWVARAAATAIVCYTYVTMGGVLSRGCAGMEGYGDKGLRENTHAASPHRTPHALSGRSGQCLPAGRSPVDAGGH